MIYYRLSQRTIYFIKCKLYLFGHFIILILIQTCLLLTWDFSWPPSLPLFFLVSLLSAFSLFCLSLIISLCYCWNPVFRHTRKAVYMLPLFLENSLVPVVDGVLISADFTQRLLRQVFSSAILQPWSLV